MQRLSLCVGDVVDVAERIRLFSLRPLDAASLLPAWSPGAHVEVHLTPDLVRSYSLCGDPDDRSCYAVAVAREAASRGGSAFMFERLKAGAVVEVSLPRNHFGLVEDAAMSVLIAGGIGITPLLSMVRRLARLGRPWRLHYAARTGASAAFVDELRALAAAGLGDLVLSLGDAVPRRRLDLATIVAGCPPGTHLYCCGPQPMMRDFELATSNWPAEQVHLEHFGGAGDAALVGAATGFAVELARSGRIVLVPQGQTILAALGQAGIDVAHACKEGVCGSCEVDVLGGIPDHHDLVLSAKEKASNSSMMICCSGAKSERLVLDL